VAECALFTVWICLYKRKEGYIGLRDFSGMLIDWFQNEGFIYIQSDVMEKINKKYKELKH
jgi:hypothetical protein